LLATFAYNPYTFLLFRPAGWPFLAQATRFAYRRKIQEIGIMKTTLMLAAGLLSIIGTNALAQNNAVDQVRADNAASRHDTREVKMDRRAVHRDNAAIAMEKRDIAHDRNVKNMERRDAWRDQRREDALVAKGDLRDARALDNARRHELREVKIASRDIRHDRKVMAVDWQDRAHDKAALMHERGERRAEVTKRDHDAAKIH
jgi:hypothetical protein